jgi:uncharacterized Tic20 family protein
MNTLKELFNYVISKLISVRVLVTLLFVGTYCKVVATSLELVKTGVMKLETFLGILAGFTPLVILIVEWYFKRNDRINKSDNGKENNGGN